MDCLRSWPKITVIRWLETGAEADMVFDIALGLATLCMDVLKEGRGVLRDRQNAAFSPGDMLAVYAAMGRLRASTIAMVGALEGVEHESVEDNWKGFCRALKGLSSRVSSLHLEAVRIYSPEVASHLSHAHGSDSWIFSAFQCCEYPFAALAGADQGSPSERLVPEKLLELSDGLRGVEWNIDRDSSKVSDVSNSKLAAINQLLELDGALDQCMTSMGEFLRTNWTPKDPGSLRQIPQS